MTRKFLEDLGLAKDAIDKVMAQAGQDLEDSKKSQQAAKDENDKMSKQVAELTKQLDATKGLESEVAKLRAQAKDTKDYDALQKELDSWKEKAAAAKDEAKRLDKESKEKLDAIARETQVREFLGDKKFVNDFTRDAIVGKLQDALKGDEAKGKSLDELFKAATSGMTNILQDDVATPPVAAPIGNSVAMGDSMEAQLNAVMGITE